MVTRRQPAKDPATVARIPGLLDAVFPQLGPGVVVSLNRKATIVQSCAAVPLQMVDASSLQRAMLFELAVVVAEQLVAGGVRDIDWVACLDVAAKRQIEHFNAKPPQGLSEIDKKVAFDVGRNLAAMLAHIQMRRGGGAIRRSPKIPGYQWIASGVGDFSVGTTLVEVKCTNRRFISADYRQILMYWLLSYSAAIEGREQAWSEGVLLNPRLNILVSFSFNEMVKMIGAGRSKIELLELLSAVVGDREAQR